LVENTEVDRILQVVSNPIRRRILMRLVESSAYPLQLAKDLRVSQQSISKHLKILEKNEVVKSHIEKSKSGGPKRKYYTLSKTISMYIDITPKSFFMKNLSDKITTSDELYKTFINELKEIEKINTNEEKVKKLSMLSEVINKELNDLSYKHRDLTSIKNEINKYTEEIINEVYEADSLEHRIMWYMVDDCSVTVDELSEMLDLREKDIKDIWNILMNKFFR
jgi:predicted transcriptional regulator